MNLRYYADVLSQARNSFLFALAASATGVAFFIFAAWQMYEHDRRGWIGLIAGGLLQVISGTEFYLYGKASALATNAPVSPHATEACFIKYSSVIREKTSLALSSFRS
jgi:hypothetical protein